MLMDGPIATVMAATGTTQTQVHVDTSTPRSSLLEMSAALAKVVVFALIAMMVPLMPVATAVTGMLAWKPGADTMTTPISEPQTFVAHVVASTQLYSWKLDNALTLISELLTGLAMAVTGILSTLLRTEIADTTTTTTSLLETCAALAKEALLV